MQRRHRPSRRQSSFRWLGWLLVMLVIAAGMLVLIAPSLVTRYIRAYIRTDACREKVEMLITSKFGGTARLGTVMWNDDTASLAEVAMETAAGWEVDAGGVRVAVDFGAIRNGEWSIQNASADDLALRRMPGHAAVAATKPPEMTGDGASTIPSFLRRYIPSTTKVSGFDAHRFLLELGGAGRVWKLADSRLHLGAWSSGEQSVRATLNDGTLQTPLSAPQQKEPLKFDVATATLRLGSDQLQLSDATLRWKQQSEATLRGRLQLPENTWELFGHVNNVPLDEFLDAAWRQRLSGRIEGDLQITGAPGSAPAWKADAALKQGVLTGLPVLNKLAAYTRAERFKRIVLDICQARFRPTGGALLIEDIVIQSNGLLRIEGSVTIRGRNVEGALMLGVTPETLRWIPGADSRVFVGSNPKGPPGLVWTPVRIAGTMDAPQEDLSSRLIGAAGMSLLLDTPGKVVNQGAETLLKPVLGEDAAKIPGKVIDKASGLLEDGVKSGTGLLNKVIPLFPGK